MRNTGDMKRSGVPQITGAKNSGSVHTATSAMVPSLALQSLATETGALKHMEKEVKGKPSVQAGSKLAASTQQASSKQGGSGSKIAFRACV